MNIFADTYGLLVNIHGYYMILMVCSSLMEERLEMPSAKETTPQPRLPDPLLSQTKQPKQLGQQQPQKKIEKKTYHYFW